MDFGAVRLLGAETLARDDGGTLRTLVTLDGSFTAGNGAVSLTGVNGPSATNDGTDITLTGGDGNTSGAGGNIAAVAGGGGATGAGGSAALTAGAGGATSGVGGPVTLTSGSAQANNDNAGDISLVGGAGDGTGLGGSILLNVGTGGTQGVVSLVPPTGGTSPALRFLENQANGSNYFSLQAAASMAGNNPYTWPDAYPGTDGFALTSTTAGVLSWTDVSSGSAQIFRANLTEAGSDNFVINTGFGNGANEVVSITIRDNNNQAVIPDSITFDATVDQVTINLASYRAQNGGTLPAGFRVLAVG